MKQFKRIVKKCSECPCIYWLWDKPGCRYPAACFDVTGTVIPLDNFYPDNMPPWCPLEEVE